MVEFQSVQRKNGGEELGLKILYGGEASLFGGDGIVGTRGEFVVGLAFEDAAGLGFADAAPLFEEEMDFVFAALVAERENPFFLKGAGTGAAFSANDHPVDAV